MSSPGSFGSSASSNRGRGRARIRSDFPGSGSPPSRPGESSSSKSDETTEESFDKLSLSATDSTSDFSDTGSGPSSTMAKTKARVSEPETIGTRGAHRGARVEPEFSDNVTSRPVSLVSKQGTSGSPIALISNYFRLKKPTNWCLYQYRVDFQPQQDHLDVRKQIVKGQRALLGAFIFDGTMLFKSIPIDQNDSTTLKCVNKKDASNVDVTFRLVGKVAPGDYMYTQFYNLIIRKCLFGLELEEMGRHFYDRHAAIPVNVHKLELWPGYITSMRNHEQDTLLCVEITHKVLRQENVLRIMMSLKQNRNYEEMVEKELIGAIVMTNYNRKMYKVDQIQWAENPKSFFDKQGEPITYADYYKSRYNVEITDLNQPLLVSRPSKKEIHRGYTNNVLLLPEFCQMTGLTDNMRANFTLMKDLSQHLHMVPAKKVTAIQSFMKRVLATPAITESLDGWGVTFDKDLHDCPGRLLGREQIAFADGAIETANDKADWTMAFRSKKLLKPVNLDKWVMFVPQRDAQATDNLIRTMMKVATPLNFNIRQPMEVVKLQDIKPQTYVNAMRSAVNSGKGYEMIFAILPNNKLELYAAVKQFLSSDVGIPSQCMLAKNASSKGLMSIATKMTIQMCTKLGGEPWTIKLPLKNLMVVGFDVYSGGKGAGFSIGAMVASTSPTLASYFSCTSNHNSNEELSRNMRVDLTKCLHAYNNKNGFLPDRVIFYRDGVGEGQLGYVNNAEVAQVQEALTTIYKSYDKEIPKLSFIVVTKKINTRFFAQSHKGADNPPPGTVVDDTVTLPERYDFYLVSQAARQGTVSPTSFHVLHDTQGLSPDKLQVISYKMCHLYFNWSGTVAVPAPCQYAHKLAFLTGIALGKHANNNLSHNLHFL